MKNKVRESSLFIVVLMLVFSFFLFGSVQAAEKKFEGVTLTIPTMHGWRCFMPAVERVGEFEKATGIKIKYSLLPYYEMIEKEYIEAAAKAGVYDFATADHEGIPTLRESGAMLPLNKFIEKEYGSIEAWKEKLWPIVEVSFDEKGNVLFYPFHANQMYGVYRKDLFDDPKEKKAFKKTYGYELRPPKTFEELVDTAKFFTRDIDGDGKIDVWGIVLAGNYKQSLREYFDLTTAMGVNAKALDEQGRVRIRKGTKDYEMSLKAAQYWHDLIYEYKVSPPNATDLGHAQIWEMWKKGKIAMSHFWWGDYWPSAEIKIPGPVGSFALPHLPGVERYGWGSWWTLGIFKTCRHPEAAFEYLRWVTSEEIQYAMSEYSGQASPSKNYTEYGAKKGWVAPALLEELKKASYPWQNIYSWQMMELYRTHLQEMLSGAITPEEMVDRIAKGLQEIFKR